MDTKDSLVNAFLHWKLPDTVCSDLCVTDREYAKRYPGTRCGTNLLTADDARQMVEHVFGAQLSRMAELQRDRAALAARSEVAERERDEARAERNALAKKVYVPGLWKCAKCGFTLVQRVLRASDGAIGVRDEAGENCPNDGSPLWRVSERDAGNELADRSQEYLERATAAERERDDAKKRIAVLEDSLDWFADVNGDGPQRDAARLLGERATP